MLNMAIASTNRLIGWWKSRDQPSRKKLKQFAITPSTVICRSTHMATMFQP
jgi:hypothetical protein